jgi:DNA-binding transcriptional LysR family regulator
MITLLCGSNDERYHAHHAPEEQVKPYLADGRLIRVLTDWCEPFTGYHLYYPSRRQPTPAFGLLVDALSFRSQ